jgi:hypothetical protein
MSSDTQSRNTERRFGLGREAFFRLWKAAVKDDEALLDDALAAAYDRMMRVDPERADEVMTLIIRRQKGARQAFRDILARIKARVMLVDNVAAAAASGFPNSIA